MNTWKKKLGLGMVLAGAVLGASLSQGFGAEIHAAPAEEPYLHKAATETVTLQPAYRLEREFAGEVRAGQTSELGFELGGQVTELLVDEGDEIFHGQVIARLDIALLESRGRELEARTEELRAELETTKRDLERIERLSAESLASERERDNLAGRVRVLQASMDRASAALEANQIRLAKSELRAPFDSRIAARHVDSGVVVNAGTAIFSLVESGAREVRAGVPLRVAETLNPGDELDVRAGAELARGRVIQVSPVVNQATRSRTVRVAVDNDWSPGEIAYLIIATDVEILGVWLPDTAVTEGMRGTWVVYAAAPVGDARAVLEARSVIIHHARDGRLFVSGALRDGDEVVTGGLHRYAPGQIVRPEPRPVIANAP